MSPGRRLLWSATALVPLDIAVALAGAGDTVRFLLSAAALVPLAWVIGTATERVSVHTGPAVAGLFNASFGNAPELMVALFSVHRGLFAVVRGSLVGSIVGNLLLVLGFSLALGPRAELSRRTTREALGQVALAVGAFAVPAAAAGAGAGVGFLPSYSLPPMALLLATYLVVTVGATRREIQEFRALEPGEVTWSLRRSLAVLAAATVATVAVSEILTGSIAAFGRASGMSQFFIAAVIVAVVGNAAEHGGAIVLAVGGNARIAAEIALGSAAQVGLFVVPVVVFASLALRPLPLDFRAAELVGLAVAVTLPAALLADGTAARWKGVLLGAGYGAVVALFWVVG